jgi:hypothetical protein
MRLQGIFNSTRRNGSKFNGKEAKGRVTIPQKILQVVRKKIETS